MRMLVTVTCPIEPFNTLVRNGTAGEIIGRVVDDIKPESIYFTELDGHRGAVMVVDVADPSGIPAIAEPWFLNFEAVCEFRIAMTTEDLMKSNLTQLAEKWQTVQMN
ncbi:panthothenate synthetase [Aestuariivivens insulae]|uniref:panthothenate synthetase n=1 Tax=Aestuariivivens insulae TaxID=1621988 RepID=UPI001F57BC46|nr:panthothenate synthetase [Aestuariivivens insulae]